MNAITPPSHPQGQAISSPNNLPPNQPQPPVSVPGVPVKPLDIPGINAVRRPWLAMLSVLSLFIALIGTFIIYSLRISTESRITAAEDRIQVLQTELSNPPLADTDKQYKLIANSLQGYKTASARRLEYYRFFTELPTLLPNNISLDSLLIDEKGQVRMAGRTDSFDNAGLAKLAVEKISYFSSAKLDTVGLSESGGSKKVGFTISATLKKDRLMANAKPTISGATSPTASPQAQPTNASGSEQ